MAKSKISNKKVKPKLTRGELIKTKSTKKEPITRSSIWHIVIGILALLAIVAVIFLSIPK